MGKRRVIGIFLALLVVAMLSGLATATKEANSSGLGATEVLFRMRA